MYTYIHTYTYLHTYILTYIHIQVTSSTRSFCQINNFVCICVSEHKHSLREHSNVLARPTASRVLSYCTRERGQSKMKAPTVQPRPTRVGRLFADAHLFENETIGLQFRNYAVCSAMCSKHLGSGGVLCSTTTHSLRVVLSHVLQAYINSHSSCD